MLSKLQIEEITNKDLNCRLSDMVIYKYSSYDIGVNKILIENTLNFSHPTIFNDPFDCNEKLLKMSLTKEELIELFNHYKTKVPESYWDILWKKINDPLEMEKFNKSQRDRLKISCFSKKYNEILMWSHYANKHSGICVGFDFPDSYMEDFVLVPVRYVPELKSVDGMASINRVLLYWLTTKSERWKYEEEIRAIRRTENDEKMELISFDPKYIKEVIFGCNVRQDFIDEGIMKIKNSDLELEKIVIKKMSIDTNTFLLKEELIKF